MNVRFPFKIRQAMNVAFAVAESEQEFRPALMSIRGEVPTFHFEEGLVVKVNIIDLDQFTESWRTPHFADWVVTHVEIRTGSGSNKVSEIWEADKLSQLKQIRPWHHPHVQDRFEIKGSVGIFVDSAAGEGYVEIDPEYNQSGHYTKHDFVEYRRFVDGDLDRAKAEAEKKLDELLKVNAVAVFFNAPAAEAYYEDSPPGNYKGSGHHPFNFMTEYPYDPSLGGDRERALGEAAAHVHQLLTKNR